MKSRNLQFDIARVLAMLWIVGIWHLSGYIKNDASNWIEFHGASAVTNMALGTFMFISGYFLSKYQFLEKGDVKEFYKKRFKRFYALYAIAAITMYLGGMNPGLPLLFTTLTGLSSYITPQPKTLWFFSMLMSFYLFTPLIQRAYRKFNLKTLFLKIGGGILLTLVLWVLILLFEFDIRLLWCFPCYAIGLLLGRTEVIIRISGNLYVGLLSVFLYCMLIIHNVSGNEYFNIDVFVGILAILSIAYWLAKLPIAKVIHLLSYSSMAMYLFHRHLYKIGRLFYSGHDGDFPVWFAYFIVLPLAVIISYFIQYLYDKCSNYYNK